MRSLYSFMSRALVCAVFLSIFAAPAAYAQQSISGRVTIEGSGSGIPNVQVFAHTPGGQITFDFTDALGDYTIPLAPGDYFLRTSNSVGYIDEMHDGIPCLPCTGNAQAQNQLITGTPINVIGNATGIDFALRMGGRISGRVTDAAMLPLQQNQPVNLVDASGVNVAVGRTLADGTYTTATGVPTGTYFARTNVFSGHLNEAYNDVPCTNCNVLLSTPIPVTEDDVTEGIDFALSVGGTVSGTVTDSSTGNPLANVSINITTTVGGFQGGARTFLDGTWITNGLPSGTYIVRARNTTGPSPATPLLQGYVEEIFNDKPCPQVCSTLVGDLVSVTVGSDTPNVNFALTPGGRIAGVVTDATTDQPLAGVTIQIFDASGRLFTTAATNDAGAYVSLAGLPSGTYVARTINPFGYINQLFGGATCLENCLVTSGDPIDVVFPDTTGGVDFALSQGGRISGRVTGPGGVPLRNVTISVYDSAGNNVAGGFFASSAATNSLGDYTTTVGLITGDYYVRINNGLGYTNELYSDNVCLNFCDPTAGTLVHVDLGAITPSINAELEPGGRVSGTVTLTGSGAPLSGIILQVYDASGQRVAFAITDGTGKYLTNAGSPTGTTYFLRTFNQLGLVNSIYDGIECTVSCVATTGTTVAVTAGDITSGKDFVLRPDDDPDGDGIASTIDLAPAVASDDFSDVLQEGSTSGTITGRQGWNLMAADVSGGGIFAPPVNIPIGTGVQLAVTGSGAQPATVDTCSTGGAERVMLDVDGEIARFFCWPTTGSTSAFAALALPVIELREPPTGAGTVVSLTSGQAATLGSPITASPTNTEPITVSFVDAAGVVFGSFNLDASESVDAHVNADGSVTVTVLEGVITLNVRGDEVTLDTGQTQTSPPASPQLAAVGPVNFWLGLKNSDDVGTKFDVLAEVLRNGAVVGSGQLNNLAGGSSGFNNAILRTVNLAATSSGLASGDSLGLRLSVRIAEGVTGHRSGTARLWFNDAAANSRLNATIGWLANTYYLVGTTAQPGTFRLNKDAPGSGPKSTSDVLVDKAKNGNAFKSFGTWTFVVP